MRKDKAIAIKLRKSGKSYGQISNILKVPKSTLSYWLSNIEISQNAKSKISERVNSTSIAALIRRNKQQTVLAGNRARDIRKKAALEGKKLLHNPLFLVGLALYWAEGYKKGATGSKWKSVDFANSDPDMVKVIMKFFRKFLVSDESKIKVQLIAHKNIEIDKVVLFWSKVTKIPKEQFFKMYVGVNRASKGKRNPNSLTYGTVHIRINDVKLFFRVIGWIDSLKEKI